VPESAQARVTNPYGVAKRTVEDYLGTFHGLWGLEGVSLRLANVYGPRQNPHGEAGVVAIFCARLRAGQPVTIYGDGRQTRDYVYVDDVVTAFLAAADAPGDVVARQRLNIGTGVETSVVQLYDALRQAAGTGAEPEFAPPRAGELQRVSLDAGLAGRLLGWQPKIDLAEGLARTWDWAGRAML
jgi:UDP-glucose 4-epimerase